MTIDSASFTKVPKFKIFLTLFLLGLTGVFSLLLVPIEIPAGTELPFSLSLLKVISLIQSSILLAIAVFIGTNLAPRVGLSIPLIKAIFAKTGIRSIFSQQIIFGVLGGVVAYTISTFLLKISEPFLPPEYLALNQNPAKQIPMIFRILYGGICEELLIRWGLMTFIVWVQFKIFQKGEGKLKPIFYWLGIIGAAVIFGIGHLPILFTLISQPSIFLIALVVALNMIVGVIAGWLYWRKGLEAAIFAHISYHIVLILVALFFN